MTRCTLIADSLVNGEPLSDGDRAHLASCADCAQLAAVTRLVAASAVAPEPGLGFASRVTAGARERLERRRRQRVVGFSCATVAAAAIAVLVVQHEDHRAAAPVEVAQPGPAAAITTMPPDASSAEDDDVSDDELRELVRRASFERAMAPAADWNEIEAPLHHYRAVLARGGTP